MDKILAIMTPFMKKELTSVLHVHSDLNDFFKFVPKQMLPKDYGGDGESTSLSKGTFPPEKKTIFVKMNIIYRYLLQKTIG